MADFTSHIKINDIARMVLSIKTSEFLMDIREKAIDNEGKENNIYILNNVRREKIIFTEYSTNKHYLIYFFG